MVRRKKDFNPRETFSERTSERIDSLVGIFSPKRAYLRKAYRFSYDAIDSSRLRKKRGHTGGGTGDTHLSETNLFKLREINRELTRNNPLIEGMFETDRDGIIGSGPKVQARTKDTGLNTELEAAWRETMLQRPCDVTGRLNFNQFLGIAFLSYRRDGDVGVIFLDDKLQAVEGEQIGTPFGISSPPKNFEIVNGLAFSKKTKRLIGYYIGESDRKWGFIKPGSTQKYRADRVHLLCNPRRFSQSRGKPALSSAIDFIDKTCGYIDAELVAAKVQACFTMFISQEYSDMPGPYTHGISSSGETKEGEQLEKMEPGIIQRGSPGEKAVGIGGTRPSGLFDPFIQRMLTFIGRPLCMPLMLITLDFSGATFMNARIAYQKVQDAWMREQEWVVKPFVSRVWRWWLKNLIDTKQIKVKTNGDTFYNEVICKRWPYVNPWQEARADEQQVKNVTSTRTEICARQGTDFNDVAKRLGEEEKIINEVGLSKTIGEKQDAVQK